MLQDEQIHPDPETVIGEKVGEVRDGSKEMTGRELPGRMSMTRAGFKQGVQEYGCGNAKSGLSPSNKPKSPGKASGVQQPGECG